MRPFCTHKHTHTLPNPCARIQAHQITVAWMQRFSSFFYEAHFKMQNDTQNEWREKKKQAARWIKDGVQFHLFDAAHFIFPSNWMLARYYINEPTNATFQKERKKRKFKRSKPKRIRRWQTVQFGKSFDRYRNIDTKTWYNFSYDLTIIIIIIGFHSRSSKPNGSLQFHLSLNWIENIYV